MRPNGRDIERPVSITAKGEYLQTVATGREDVADDLRPGGDDQIVVVAREKNGAGPRAIVFQAAGYHSQVFDNRVCCIDAVSGAGVGIDAFGASDDLAKVDDVRIGGEDTKSAKSAKTD